MGEIKLNKRRVLKSDNLVDKFKLYFYQTHFNSPIYKFLCYKSNFNYKILKKKLNMIRILK